ncbi:50S ribosomal protein L10 [Candidatus Giovannonibacteria bacterium RIFCSPHIGHO2_02_42_15]|uniref:Large ribosomal subunit protein uL10 n=2 Tax=Candidatus Giovannoniibacteriota TaxID=1752738 RepID=A0A1F5VMG6_9BACT|nr:MAG: 50S ribosomal protein L10 [Candidatus Giovannonibacteria bacterium RIFCSPHIGHO2_02_42_15]
MRVSNFKIMPQTKQKKSELIEELKKLFDKASILVFVNFHGLSVAKERKLRKVFRLSEIKYKVSKKTLLKRVLDAVGFTDVPKLEGEVGVAAGYGETILPPQVIAKFIKEEKEGLRIIGGVYESKYVDDGVIKRLASIPTKEVLLTQLAFILSQPMAGLARAFNEVSKKMETK